jgi:heat shock protein HslJ
MKKKSIIILVLLSLFSCNCKKNTAETSTQNINRIWMLVNFKDYEKDFFVEKNCFLDMTNKEIASAKMGCNNMSFSYKTKGSNLSFSNGISTEMACLDMKLESDFSKSIIQISNFSINAHQLTLTTSDGTKMIFVAQDWD